VLDTVVDNENLPAQLDTAAAEIEHLMAQLVPTQERLLTQAANQEITLVGDRRNFSVDVEGAQLRILELKVQLETGRIALEQRALDMKLAQDLLEKDAVAPYEVQKAKVEYDTVVKTLEENIHLLEQAQKDLDERRRRRDEFARQQLEHPSVDSALEVIRKAINVQERRVEGLLARRVALELKSPSSGVVSLVSHQPGDAVQANETILTVAEPSPTEILAYVREDQVSQLREGMLVQLVKTGDRPQIAQSQVVSVGPAVEQMPPRLWLNPNFPEWGRPFLVKIPPDMKLLAGERVGIHGL
jgi:multidrug resistance efflux pump